MRYLDLSVRDEGLKAELLEAVERVLSHGRIILSPEHDQYEKAIADACGRRFGIVAGSRRHGHGPDVFFRWCG